MCKTDIEALKLEIFVDEPTGNLKTTLSAPDHLNQDETPYQTSLKNIFFKYAYRAGIYHFECWAFS